MHKTIAQCIDRITPSCAEVARLASEALDRRLTVRERISMRLHFTICYFCRRYCEQLRGLSTGLRSNAEHYGQHAGPAMPDEDKARLKQACREQRRPVE
ncbi:MAG TPA: zf-HC2 domain-containing protein [Kiritimatiellia bacterium]|nr:zf-HC2 domain-containing protein [Kiritimatiellia bacterium]